MKIKFIFFICFIACFLLFSSCNITQRELDDSPYNTKAEDIGASTDDTKGEDSGINNNESNLQLSCLYVYPSTSQKVELSEENLEIVKCMWDTNHWEACTIEIDPFYIFRGENLEIGYNHIIGTFVDLNTKMQSNLSKEENAWLAQLLASRTVLPKIEIQSIEKCFCSKTGRECLLSQEDEARMVAILNSDAWERGITKEMYTYQLEASNNAIYYANGTETGTLNDWTNDRHLTLSKEQTELVNSILKEAPFK